MEHDGQPIDHRWDIEKANLIFCSWISHWVTIVCLNYGENSSADTAEILADCLRGFAPI
jgi:hypothetical protein